MEKRNANACLRSDKRVANADRLLHLCLLISVSGTCYRDYSKAEFFTSTGEKRLICTVANVTNEFLQSDVWKACSHLVFMSLSYDRNSSGLFSKDGESYLCHLPADTSILLFIPRLRVGSTGSFRSYLTPHRDQFAHRH